MLLFFKKGGSVFYYFNILKGKNDILSPFITAFLIYSAKNSKKRINFAVK